MKIVEWLTDEPCVFPSGNLGYLTAYHVEAHLHPGHAVELVDLDGQVVHRWPPHDGQGDLAWVGLDHDHRTRLDARTVRVPSAR